MYSRFLICTFFKRWYDLSSNDRPNGKSFSFKSKQQMPQQQQQPTAPQSRSSGSDVVLTVCVLAIFASILFDSISKSSDSKMRSPQITGCRLRNKSRNVIHQIFKCRKCDFFVIIWCSSLVVIEPNGAQCCSAGIEYPSWNCDCHWWAAWNVRREAIIDRITIEIFKLFSIILLMVILGDDDLPPNRWVIFGCDEFWRQSRNCRCDRS